MTRAAEPLLAPPPVRSAAATAIAEAGRKALLIGPGSPQPLRVSRHEAAVRPLHSQERRCGQGTPPAPPPRGGPMWVAPREQLSAPQRAFFAELAEARL